MSVSAEPMRSARVACDGAVGEMDREIGERDASRVRCHRHQARAGETRPGVHLEHPADTVRVEDRVSSRQVTTAEGKVGRRRGLKAARRNIWLDLCGDTEVNRAVCVPGGEVVPPFLRADLDGWKRRQT